MDASTLGAALALINKKNDGVPTYYKANNYLKNQIDSFNAFARNGGGLTDTFAFFTDLHWHLNAGKSPALLKHIKQNTMIDKFFCGGDVCDFITGEAQPFDSFMNFHKALDCPIYTAMGNHDYMSSYGTEERLYYTFNSVGKDRVGNIGRNYFYVDNPQSKIRYIVLNGFKPGNNTWDWGFEQDQLDWLEDEALNLGVGWGAVVITHMVHAIDLDTGVISIPNTNKAMLDVLDGYSGNGEVIAVICGHTHFDYIDTTEGGIPIIVTTCDKNLAWIHNDVDKEPWLSDRTTGTIKEQAIDLFTINRDAKQITRVRIGCPIRIGIDPQSWTELSYQTIDYDHGPETLSFVYDLGRYNHKSDSASEDYVYNESGSAAYCAIYSSTETPKRIRGGDGYKYPIKFSSGATTLTVTVPSGIRVTAWFTNSTVACNASQSNPGLDDFAKLISGDSSAYDSTVPTGTRTLTIPTGADSIALSLQYPGGSITDDTMANITITAE
ncbi:MAG: metallophosphoesterase [Paludibacteraceae bacterium]|nr:metallophosphoesterase [Paludibacteraceae bacterium]